jgi:hypothetical protein
MKRHRARCRLWKDRPDPRGLSIQRRKAALLQSDNHRCTECNHRVDCHLSTCSQSLSEKARKDALLRNGINPAQFEVFLRLLAKKYVDGDQFSDRGAAGGLSTALSK